MLSVEFGRCRGDAVAALFGGAAVPGGDDAAGGVDDWDEGGDVDVLQGGFGDDVDVAGGEQAVAVAVEAPAALQGGAAQAVDIVNGAGEFEDVGRGGGDLGAGEVGDAGGADRRGATAMHIECFSRQADEGFADEGLGHEAGDGATLVEKADQRAPDGDPGDEGAGAVDGIDDPVIGAGGGFGVPFLTDDAMVGEAIGDHGADGDFGVAVGGSDRIETGFPFVLDGERRAEAGEGAARGGARRFDQHVAHQRFVETTQMCRRHAEPRN